MVPCCTPVDAGDKWLIFDRETLESLGVSINDHGKMPDLVVHMHDRNWVVLLEAASTHGPVDNKRHIELKEMFNECTAGLVFVSCFPDQATMKKTPDGHIMGNRCVDSRPSNPSHTLRRRTILRPLQRLKQGLQGKNTSRSGSEHHTQGNTQGQIQLFRFRRDIRLEVPSPHTSTPRRNRNTRFCRLVAAGGRSPTGRADVTSQEHPRCWTHPLRVARVLEIIGKHYRVQYACVSVDESDVQDILDVLAVSPDTGIGVL